MATATNTTTIGRQQSHNQSLRPSNTASASRFSSLRYVDDNPAYLVLKPDLRTVISPFRRVLIPETPVSEFFLELIEVHQDQLAIVDASTGHKVTYAQLAGGIRRVAASLFCRYLRHGDVVAILAPNIPEYAVVFHATSLYGGVVTTLNPEWSDSELLAQLSALQVRHIFTDPAQAARVSALWTKLTQLDSSTPPRDPSNIFVFGKPESGSNHTAFADLLHPDSLFPDQNINPHEQVAAVFYMRDAATGELVGLEFTHYNLTAALVQGLAYDDMVPQDRILACAPFHTPYGLCFQMNVALARGVNVVVHSSPAPIIDLLAEYTVSRLCTDNARTLSTLNDSVQSAKAIIASLQCIVYGGPDAAAISSDSSLISVVQALEQSLSLPVRILYGIHESIATHGVLKGSSIDSVAGSGAPPGSVGQLLPNVECVVIEPRSGVLLPANYVGEIHIRAPQCFSGYVDHTRNASMNADGWIRTGFIGHYDRKGYFYVRKA